MSNVGRLIIELFRAKKRVSTLSSRRSACGPNESLEEWLSSFTENLASLVLFVLMLSTYCEIKIQIVVIQYPKYSLCRTIHDGGIGAGVGAGRRDARHSFPLTEGEAGGQKGRRRR